MKKRLVVDKDAKMKIAVYHIGYSKEGESSIFILHDEERIVYYSMVIDCYEEEQCNLTDIILDTWGMAEKKIDMLLWTHPHDDHSKGLVRIIKKYCGEISTKICTANIFGDAQRFSVICRDNICFLNSLVHGRTAGKRIKIHPLHCYPDIMDDVELVGCRKFDRLLIQCIAPIPDIGGIQGVDETFSINKIGLGCIVKLEGAAGKIHMLFAGDMDKMSFEALIAESNPEIPEVYNYIKIPHHGSTDGEKLIEFLGISGEISEYASSSVYIKSHLPSKAVLSRYGKVVETLICTSDIIGEHYGKGVVYLDFNLDTTTINTQYYGTAAIVDTGKLKESVE